MRTCQWSIDLDDCCEALPSPLEPNDPKVMRVIETVSAMMSRWSGYSVGLCSETVRPLNICPECRSFCCGGRDGIRLSSSDGSPVHSVTEVLLDGAPLDESEWRYDREQSTLWRVGGSWPVRDDRGLELSEPGTFGVEIVTGSEPDGWARWAATQLACEMLSACSGAKCRLPRNATQVSAQGVTIQLSDEEIQFMIPEVAAWVAAVNPHKARVPARIFSPEAGTRRSPSAVPMRGPRVPFASSGGCCGN